MLHRAMEPSSSPSSSDSSKIPIPNEPTNDAAATEEQSRDASLSVTEILEKTTERLALIKKITKYIFLISTVLFTMISAIYNLTSKTENNITIKTSNSSY